MYRYSYSPAGVLVSLAESSIAVSEEDGLVNITVILTGTHSVPVTASATTLSGTAIGIIHHVDNIHVLIPNKLVCIFAYICMTHLMPSKHTQFSPGDFRFT